MEENVCRICRWEGTPDDPLFYPCKCKGSIKYIHQGCLTEWLAHSKKDPVCDICHEKYHFTTVFDDSVPAMVPPKVLLHKAFKFSLHLVSLLAVALSFVFFILLEIPIYTRMLFRVLFIHFRVERYSLWKIAFGDAEFDTQNWLSWGNVWTYMKSTYFGGLFAFHALILLAVILFTQNEWVSKDEGFTKILNRRIGPEKAYRDVDAERLLNAFIPVIDERIRHVRMEAGLDEQGEPANDPIVDPAEEFRRQIGAAAERIREEEEEWQDFQEPAAPEWVGEPEQVDPRAEVEQLERLRRDMLEGRRRIDQRPEDVGAEVIPMGAEAPLEEAPILNFDFDTYNAVLALQLAGIANLITFGMCLIFWFVPHLLGSAAMVAVLYPVHTLFTTVSNYLSLLLPTVSEIPLNWMFAQIPYHESVHTGLSWLTSHYAHPFLEVYFALLDFSATHKPSDTEIYCKVVSGYVVILLGIMSIMKYFERGCSKQHPLTGVYRSYYTVLLEIVSTLKLFAVFGTEQMLFPSYCGFLLDYVLSPLLLPSGSGSWLYQKDRVYIDKVGLVLLWFMRWVVGTMFMCLFALYVGFVRRSILRPGVLYFIKSPDDPNARLVHDALVRPLSLQMSRIALSAVVYSMFIILEIGGSTYGLRYISKTGLLPVKFGFVSFCMLLKSVKINLTGTLVDFFVDFWKLVFRVSCRVLRLSHFILNTPEPKERGRVVYRNALQRILRRKPDYSKPMSYEDALKVFADDSSVQSIFVPDGTFLRVPDNDNVSRRYLKELFLPVTKDDELLDIASRPRPATQDTANYSDDEDVHPIRTHMVVYSPPNLGRRSLMLLAFIWLFAVGLALITMALEIVLSLSIYHARAYFLSIILGSDFTASEWDSRISFLYTLLVLQMMAFTHKFHKNESGFKEALVSGLAKLWALAKSSVVPCLAKQGSIWTSFIFHALHLSPILDIRVFSGDYYSLKEFFHMDMRTGWLVGTLLIYVLAQWPFLTGCLEPRLTLRERKAIKLVCGTIALEVVQLCVYGLCFYLYQKPNEGILRFASSFLYKAFSDEAHLKILRPIAGLDWLLCEYLCFADDVKSFCSSLNANLKAEYYGAERRLTNAT